MELPPLPSPAEKKTVDRLFRAGLLVKGFAGVLELVAGVGALFLTTDSVLSFVQMIVQGTLDTDPDNPFANYVLGFAAGYRPVATNLILFAYFVGHGVINIGLVTLLLRKKMWAYPLALGVFGVLVAYELWQVWQSSSISLGVFTIFDLIVVGLIYEEYQFMLAKRARA